MSAGDYFDRIFPVFCIWLGVLTPMLADRWFRR